MTTRYVHDCDVYCEECAPTGAEATCDGEVDAPEHCEECRKLIDVSLTSDGVDYVIAHMVESQSEPDESLLAVHDCYAGSYYAGCPHGQIVRDWAAMLDYYSLDDDDQEVVDNYTERFDALVKGTIAA